MNKREKIEEIVILASQKAANLYEKQGLCCSESLLVMMSRAFGGDLSLNIAKRIGAGFCHGMGDAGCSCGALSGGVAALGLFLSPHSESGFRKNKFRPIVKKLHDQFRGKNKATCCRILTKNVKHDKRLRKRNCIRLTSIGAELATRILLEARPSLAEHTDYSFLKSREKVE